MVPRWLRRLMGLPPTTVTKQTLLSYRASYAQYVAVRTFHTNVQHWLTKAEEALHVIQEDGEFNRATHPMTDGLKEGDLELWFSVEDYQLRPQDVWPILMETRQQILTAITHTTSSTQDYHRRMTKGLLDDVSVIEHALHDCADAHRRGTKLHKP